MPHPSVVVDPASDTSGIELSKLAKAYRFPDFVKSADMASTMNSGNVAVSAYADPVRQKFACHSAPATWLSAVYFHDKSAEYHPKDRERICDRLERFADYFGIRPDYDAIVKRATELRNDSGLPDSSYAFVWADETGHKERYYPLTNSTQVKIAAEWLLDNRDRIPFADRHTIGKRILEKAAAYAASLSEDLADFLEKQAGKGVPDMEELYCELCNRSHLAKSAEHKAAILKLAEAVKKTPREIVGQQSLVKLAETMELTDHTLGIYGKYTDTIRRPDDIVFKTTFRKAASEMLRIVPLQTGNIYAKEQLAKLAREDVVSLLGDDFASEVSTGLDLDPEKFAEQAATLPLPDAQILDRMLNEIGQYPQFRDKSAHDALTASKMAASASSYRR